MTVALVLAAEADAGMCGQLAALGVRRVDLAGSGAYGAGLLTVAAAARVAGERVMLCVGDGPVPGEVLARLIDAGGTAAFTGRTGGTGGTGRTGGTSGSMGVLVVDAPDLDALADAALSVATTSHKDPDPIGALITELARLGVPTLVLDADPAAAGAVARLLADPVAQHISQWALARDLAPSSLAGISAGLGLIAAAWFTESSLSAKAIAIAALLAAFMAGRAASLVAASGRWSNTAQSCLAMDWLSTAAALSIELAIYAGLAFRVGTLGTWRLAMAAMGMLAVRTLAELCYDRAAQRRSLRRSALNRFEQVITLPAGERYLLIAVTVLFASPRVTFLALLGWGVVAAAYVLAGRVFGQALLTAVAGDSAAVAGDSAAVAGVKAEGIDDLPAYRDDGIASHWIGSIVQGRLPPLLAAVVGLLVTSVLAALGMANLPGILVLTPVEAMLLAGLGSWHPHDGPWDWLAPPLLLAGEFVFIAALGLAQQVPPVAVAALLAAVVLRHVDVAFRARHAVGISVDSFGLGWDGRMLLLGLAALSEVVPFAYYGLAGYLWLLFAWDFLGGWLTDTEVDRGYA
jgi:hypothetical protein